MSFKQLRLKSVGRGWSWDWADCFVMYPWCYTSYQFIRRDVLYFRGKFTVLEDTSCRIKPGCTEHPPWPGGICTKCQPGAITLKRQVSLFVDGLSWTTMKAPIDICRSRDPNISHAWQKPWKLQNLLFTVRTSRAATHPVFILCPLARVTFIRWLIQFPSFFLTNKSWLSLSTKAALL